MSDVAITGATLIGSPRSERLTPNTPYPTKQRLESTSGAEEKLRISLKDIHFAHCESVGGPFSFPAVPFEWDRATDESPLIVYTDNSLEEAVDQSYRQKVAWLVESPLATAKAYLWIRRHYEYFNLVLTFDQELLEDLPNSRPVLLGGCWIRETDRRLHAKTKNVSIIASTKKAIRKNRDRIDAILGGGYQPINDKIDGLGPFRYSIVIENCRRNYYFSEKLIDCFMTGTIPIYWGCPSIGLFFDKTGMICFETLSELKKILQSVGEEDYEERRSAAQRNLETAKQYIYPEYALWAAVKDLAV